MGGSSSAGINTFFVLENNEHIPGKTDQVIARYGTTAEAVLPVLQAIQHEFGYLPEPALKRICATTRITPAQIQGVATFYNHFRFTPAGKHTIMVCTGTACHVKGSQFVYEALRRELKLEGESDTDASMIFTLEKVACLGCCTLAPVVRVDDITYGHVLPEKAGEVLRDFLEKRKFEETTASKVHDIKGNAQGEIRIGLGSCCVASGSAEIKTELERTLAKAKIAAVVQEVGCVGICNQVPVMEIVKPGEKPVFYARIRPEEVREVVLSHFRPEGLISRAGISFSAFLDRLLAEGSPKSFRKYAGEQRDTPFSRFLGPQMNIATESRGITNPVDFDGYRRSGGFEAWQKCLAEMTPQQVVNEIISSGLRGRGGAGFPTGQKWQLLKNQDSREKYVICNGDEGDPGAFMDRMLLESYPFRIIEGMLIAAYATGATHGYFYIRAEYPLAVRRISEAIEICKAKGLFGTALPDSGFSFDIRVFGGAGAFVCGEETALIASIEGKRGMPRMRPPYPVTRGLWNNPTLINNTETLSLVPWIIQNGAQAFAGIGTGQSKGTKVFALAGKVKRGGLIEVPMGVTIRQIVEEIGGGITGDKKFKAVQIGGPSGGCLPASMAGLQVDFEALKQAGTMMGSGGLIVLDETDCMVDIAHYFLSFTRNQSCGKCTFCRIGTRRMLELLEKIRNGTGTADDLTALEKLATSTAKGSLCGLGRTAPNPVLTTLHYFREEYEAHLKGKCLAGKCLPLIHYEVTEACNGCTKCAQRCPSDAIAFKPYEKHWIDVEKCIKCDICRQVCPEEAIIVT
jgi:NADH:ubiquinone oxidoreductase subunit F (NADH-binding)/NADH:ubiquinone oxidoreductase subunit E/NAD-dependent dihydropyrimidine dehydrogenase PreA subunit